MAKDGALIALAALLGFTAQAQRTAWAQGFNLSGDPRQTVKDETLRFQQAVRTGDLDTVANTAEILAGQVKYQGFGRYAPGVDPDACYVDAAAARINLIARDTRRGDKSNLLLEWRKLLFPAYQLTLSYPSEPSWFIVEGLCYYELGPSTYKNARAWLAKGLQMPNCPPKLQQTARTVLADMDRQEQASTAQPRSAFIDALIQHTRNMPTDPASIDRAMSQPAVLINTPVQHRSLRSLGIGPGSPLINPIYAK